MAPKDLFDFAPHVFDRVVIRRIGRQIQEAGANCLDGLAHPLDFVSGQIIHDDHIACLERRRQSLNHPG